MRVASGIADDVGIDPAPLQAWQQQVRGRAAETASTHRSSRTTLGYLTVEMQVQHLGISGNNYVHLIFTWA